MKVIYLMILVCYLLQPLACFAHPCDSSLGSSVFYDTSGKTGSHSHSQDADNFDSAICCSEYVILNFEFNVIYAPFVSVIAAIERHQKLPAVFIPIFIPPQNLA